MPASVAAAAAAAGIPASMLALVEKAAPLSVAEYRSSVLALRGRLEGAAAAPALTDDLGASLGAAAALGLPAAAGDGDVGSLDGVCNPNPGTGAPGSAAAWLELAELQARGTASGDAAPARARDEPNADPNPIPVSKRKPRAPPGTAVIGAADAAVPAATEACRAAVPDGARAQSPADRAASSGSGGSAAGDGGEREAVAGLLSDGEQGAARPDAPRGSGAGAAVDAEEVRGTASLLQCKARAPEWYK